MTDRRKFIAQVTMAASAATFLRPLNIFAGSSRQNPFLVEQLTILHTSNLQGQWEMLPENDKLHGLGGLRQLSRQIKEIRSKTAATLVIHTGSIADPPIKNNEEPFCKTMYSAGYDVICTNHGTLLENRNHDFSLHNENQSVPPAKKTSSFSDVSLPSTLVKKGNIRIGIINADTGSNASFSHLALAINKTARMLNNSLNSHIVVCIMPPFVNCRHPLAKLSSGVDIMLCSIEKTTIHNTDILRNKAGEELILSYAGKKGTTISRMDLTFGKQQERTGFASKAIFVGAREGYTGIMKQYNLHYA